MNTQLLTAAILLRPSVAVVLLLTVISLCFLAFLEDKKEKKKDNYKKDEIKQQKPKVNIISTEEFFSENDEKRKAINDGKNSSNSKE